MALVLYAIASIYLIGALIYSRRLLRAFISYRRSLLSTFVVMPRMIVGYCLMILSWPLWWRCADDDR